MIYATIEQVSDKAFDYVIVGGGTAGLVMAGRLTEDPNVTVCVLEAGMDHVGDPRVSIPGNYGFSFKNPLYDYNFKTVPQKYCENSVSIWPRGKGVGGSSFLNFYVWFRPNAEDIDAIEELGNPGWNWKQFVEYSKKSETFIPPSGQVSHTDSLPLTWDPQSHGQNGPIKTGFRSGQSGWEPTLRDTLKRMNVEPLEDPSCGRIFGTFRPFTTINPETHQRSYAIQYLEAANGRLNLNILTSAVVCKVITSETKHENGNVVATGVEFLHQEKKHLVRAKREVLVCAGAIQSPQILELSGIGDPAVLDKIGVSVKVSLPGVGNNVQEHVQCSASYELKEPDRYLSLQVLSDPSTWEEQAKLAHQGQGLMLLGPTNFMMLSLDSITSDAGDIIAKQEAKLKEKYDTLSTSLKKQYEIQMRNLKKNLGSLEFFAFPTFMGGPNPSEPGKKYVTIKASINHPWSRGSIHAASTDPTIQPVIDPRYFEDDFDLTTLYEMFKFVRSIPQNEPISECFGKEVNPGADVQDEKDIKSYIKQTAATVFHTSGSCSMLPKELDGVVDPKLRVYGTENIRVIDLSVLPLQIASHTQSFVYALAERAADIIKGKI